VITRREILFALGAGALTVPLASFAQQQTAKIPRLGWLAARSSTVTLDDAFRQGLRQLDYVEGKNIVIEYRNAEAQFDRLPALAAELVRLKVDVILASGGVQPVLAARNSTTTIPIVMSNVIDPVALGLVASLAKPGGNVTGLSTLGVALAGKHLELLKESFPKISRVAVLWNPGNPGSVAYKRDSEATAGLLGIKLLSVEIRQPSDFEQAFLAMKREHAEALVTVNSPVISNQQKRIVELVAQSRLPAMYWESQWVESGGLMSYGPSYLDLYRRAATYVDKILKGAKPADLPVEQPTTFELVINMKTAKALGIKFPNSILVRADKVIE
jgi:putative ABC transport system substrate-binding protein